MPPTFRLALSLLVSVSRNGMAATVEYNLTIAEKG